MAERSRFMRESLKRSQTITDSMITILSSFDHRLSDLESAMRPTQVLRFFSEIRINKLCSRLLGFIGSLPSWFASACWLEYLALIKTVKCCQIYSLFASNFGCVSTWIASSITKLFMFPVLMLLYIDLMLYLCLHQHVASF